MSVGVAFGPAWSDRLGGCDPRDRTYRPPTFVQAVEKVIEIHAENSNDGGGKSATLRPRDRIRSRPSGRRSTSPPSASGSASARS